MIKNNSTLANFLEKEVIPQPKVGDTIEAQVIAVSKSEVLLDVFGLTSGIVRGKGLGLNATIGEQLSIGETVQADVIELENENGQLELSFAKASFKKNWEYIHKIHQDQTILETEVTDANRGGLIVKVSHTSSFLPVSQLSNQHYPRVEGGDKQKILKELKQYVGQVFSVKVINVDQDDNKVIVSEKAAWEQKNLEKLEKLKVGDVINGTVNNLVDFGAFVGFDNELEGLVHISEFSWQRVKKPQEVLSLGQEVKAKIINIQKHKVFLSLKQLTPNPWETIANQITEGQKIKGIVKKITPYGLFVEVLKSIQALAPAAEIAKTQPKDIKLRDLFKIDQEAEFYVRSLNIQNQRLILTQQPTKNTQFLKETSATKETTKPNSTEKTSSESLKAEEAPSSDKVETPDSTKVAPAESDSDSKTKAGDQPAKSDSETTGKSAVESATESD